jgi:hypothetical protein
MTNERMLRLIQSTASWLVAASIFEVYNEYFSFAGDKLKQEFFFDNLFLKYGKSYKERSRRWRINSLMQLVKLANIYTCLDSIIDSKNKTKSFMQTRENARKTKELFIKKYGANIPPIIF